MDGDDNACDGGDGKGVNSGDSSSSSHSNSVRPAAATVRVGSAGVTAAATRGTAKAMEHGEGNAGCRVQNL